MLKRPHAMLRTAKMYLLEQPSSGLSYWIDPIRLQKSREFRSGELRRIRRIIEEKQDDIYSGPHCQDHFSRKIRQRLSSPVMDFRWCLIGQRLVWSLVVIIVEIGVESLGQLRYGLV